MDRIPCSKCGAMILPITAEVTGGLCMPCKKNPGGKACGPGIGKLGNLGKFLSGKMALPEAQRTDWLELCKIEISSGRLWIGDPLVANDSDGCVATVPKGIYCVEGIGCLSERNRTIFCIRARLDSGSGFEAGKTIGETGTDSAMIGICDIGVIEGVGKEAGEEIQEVLEEKTLAGYGRIGFKRFPKFVMAFVPSGDGDGGGPVKELVANGQRVGLQHSFFPDEEPPVAD